MSDTEKERLQEELLSLRVILTMGGLVKEERASLKQRIQSLESELQIGKPSTQASASSSPASSLAPSHYFVKEELERLRSIQKGGVDKEIKLLEDAQSAGIKKYRSMESLKMLVMVFKDPPR
ncbi:MAG: hypothetical protein K2X28_06305 [Alphaproteobacteria bacterium]|nr:hypothetical protein [Alphaproteobacteria bacterium]